MANISFGQSRYNKRMNRSATAAHHRINKPQWSHAVILVVIQPWAYGIQYVQRRAGSFRDFLESESWPTEIRWLVRSRCRCDKLKLFVYKPASLIDFEPHERRFKTAIEHRKNIAFVAYARDDKHTFASLETPGIDPEDSSHKESGSHNLKTTTSKIQLIPIQSSISWLLTRTLTSNKNSALNYLGWPA